MSAEAYIKSLCPLCDGAIEFPAHALGEDANCPHCQNIIKLGRPSEPPIKLPSLSNPLRQQIMNLDRKVLTGIAIFAFIISACNASWEIRYEFDGKIEVTEIVVSPIWQPPSNLSKTFPSPGYYNSHSETGRPYLLIAPLAGIWIGIGVIYTGLFFLLKETELSAKISKKLKLLLKM